MNKILTTCIAIVAILFSTYQLKAQEVEKLFNGKDLSNWNFVLENDDAKPENVFFVQDGLINITGDPIGYMYTKNKYSNFHLHAEWRWPNGVESNSGIFLLIEDPANPFPRGIECQLKAGIAGDLVLLNGSNLAEYKLPAGQERPRFPVVKKLKDSSEKPASQWNEANIYCRDGIITVYINGVYQNKGTNPVKEGNIGLQSEGKNIQFRNVTLTPLP